VGGTMLQNRLWLCRTVALVGMMGSGKTAIGCALAMRLGSVLRDSDAEIEESTRMTVARIFERDGEAFFREKEGQVIARLLNGSPCVLSTGGGAWLSPQNRKVILAKAAVLWLEADLELLWARIRNSNKIRPLLRTENPRVTLAQLLTDREPAYRTAPHRVKVHPDWSIDRTTAAVVKVLQGAGVIRSGGRDD